MTIEITEEWARTAPAGPALDRVCAEWMGWIIYDDGEDGYVYAEDPNDSGIVYCLLDPIWNISDELVAYSTEWSAAGPLLEAMRAEVGHGYPHWWCMVTHSDLVCGEDFIESADWRTVAAPTPQLAIARACAVLVARGISREGLS